MPTLTCPRCNAKTECNSIEEGRPLLDHAVGLHIGKPCEDGKVELVFTGKVKTKSPEKPVTNTVSKKQKPSFS